MNCLLKNSRVWVRHPFVSWILAPVLDVLPHVEYTALDFSAAMHDLAREMLGKLHDRVRFIEADFKIPEWSAGLASFHAIVAMQSVHELRHKRHAPRFFSTIRRFLHPEGIFLFCDHYVGEGGMTETNLYMTTEEQQSALREGGFADVTLILQKGGLALWRARDASRP